MFKGSARSIAKMGPFGKRRETWFPMMGVYFRVVKDLTAIAREVPELHLHRCSSCELARFGLAMHSEALPSVEYDLD